MLLCMLVQIKKEKCEGWGSGLTDEGHGKRGMEMCVWIISCHQFCDLFWPVFSFYTNNIKELITEKNNDALTYKFQRVNTIHTTQSRGMTNMRL